MPSNHVTNNALNSGTKANASIKAAADGPSFSSGAKQELRRFIFIHQEWPNERAVTATPSPTNNRTSEDFPKDIYSWTQKYHHKTNKSEQQRKVPPFSTCRSEAPATLGVGEQSRAVNRPTQASHRGIIRPARIQG